jgi:hypothetical protein
MFSVFSGHLSAITVLNNSVTAFYKMASNLTHTFIFIINIIKNTLPATYRWCPLKSMGNFTVHTCDTLGCGRDGL